MEQDKLNLWIAELAQSQIESMKDSLDKYKDSLDSAETNQVHPLRMKYNDRLVKRHNQIHEILKQLTDSVVIPSEEGEEDVILIPDQLRSQTLLVLGEYEYFISKYDIAFEYAERSFNLYRSQRAKYFMAISYEKLTIKTGAFSGKKGKAAQEEKDQQTINHFLDTIKMDPYSVYGIDSGVILINKYGYEFKTEDIFI
jgi:tetratricopeptide (TPR) repeat protein